MDPNQTSGNNNSENDAHHQNIFKQLLNGNKKKILLLNYEKLKESLKARNIISEEKCTKIEQGQQGQKIDKNSVGNLWIWETKWKSSLFAHLLEVLENNSEFSVIVDCIRDCDDITLADALTNDYQELKTTVDLCDTEPFLLEDDEDLQKLIINSQNENVSYSQNETDEIVTQEQETQEIIRIRKGSDIFETQTLVDPHELPTLAIKNELTGDCGDVFDEREDEDIEFLQQVELIERKINPSSRTEIEMNQKGGPIPAANVKTEDVNESSDDNGDEEDEDEEIEDEEDEDHYDYSDYYQDDYEDYDYDDSYFYGGFARSFQNNQSSRYQSSNLRLPSGSQWPIPAYQKELVDNLNVQQAIERQSHSNKTFIFHASFQVKSFEYNGIDSICYEGCPQQSLRFSEDICGTKVNPTGSGTYYHDGHTSHHFRIVPKLQVVFSDCIGNAHAELSGILWRGNAEIMMGYTIDHIVQKRSEPGFQDWVKSSLNKMIGRSFKVEVKSEKYSQAEARRFGRGWNNHVTLINEILKTEAQTSIPRSTIPSICAPPEELTRNCPKTEVNSVDGGNLPAHQQVGPSPQKKFKPDPF